ncbi:Catenin-beta-like protein [Tribonema minus]|uniref:Catenin-beta-like protein n=1 Tax=Tribonema minus TaxID=303371 RepID=A0A835YND4_9STRA|nr:Catenin-beta-like protein [Tribonema minus]
MQSSRSFIPASTFKGLKQGYTFKTGDSGTGYYLDETAVSRGGADYDGVRNGKQNGRHAEEEEEEEEAGAAAAGKVDVEGLSLEDLDEETIARMLEEADKEQVNELDVHGLRQLLATLERRIVANQRLRIRHPDEPDKFVESEVDLDEAIKSLQVVATAPEFYPRLVEHGAVTSLLGLLTHDNTDISISAITLLQDVTDADVVMEAVCVVDAVVEAHGLALLVQNLSRLDESNEDDARGVYATMGVLENLLEVKPSLGPVLCEDTSMLSWLLKRVKAKTFDDNKLYASELLNMLANSDTAIQRRLGDVGGVDGVDQLLQACAPYRRKEPSTPEEEECVENLFGTLAATQLVAGNQTRFRHSEGFELMIRCLREKKYAALCAIKVLDYATTNNAINCEHLVDCGGLKAIFPVFMGRAAARKLRKAHKLSRGDARSLEEHCISLVSSLALYLEDMPAHDSLSRFVAKFLEDDYEKTDRLMELYVEYASRVAAFEAHAANDMQTGDSDSDSEKDSPELDALAAGGYALQRLAALMAAVAARAPLVAERCDAKLRQHGHALGGVRAVIGAYMEGLGGDAAAAGLRDKLAALMPVEEGQEDSAPPMPAALPLPPDLVKQALPAPPARPQQRSPKRNREGALPPAPPSAAGAKLPPAPPSRNAKQAVQEPEEEEEEREEGEASPPRKAQEPSLSPHREPSPPPQRKRDHNRSRRSESPPPRTSSSRRERRRGSSRERAASPPRRSKRERDASPPQRRRESPSPPPRKSRRDRERDASPAPRRSRHHRDASPEAARSASPPPPQSSSRRSSKHERERERGAAAASPPRRKRDREEREERPRHRDEHRRHR